MDLISLALVAFKALPSRLPAVPIAQCSAASKDRKERGGHPEPNPDLLKSQGGHPESRDEKIGENRDISRFIPSYLSKKIGKSWDISRFSPTLGSKVGIIWDISRLNPNYLEILKSRDGHPDPDLSKSWGGHPNPDPRPVPTRFYPPRDISPIAVRQCLVPFSCG